MLRARVRFDLDGVLAQLEDVEVAPGHVHRDVVDRHRADRALEAPRRHVAVQDHLGSILRDRNGWPVAPEVRPDPLRLAVQRVRRRRVMETEHDVDFLIKPEDVPTAQDAFAAAGLNTERPPEGWLLKTGIDGILVDLIFDPQDGPVDHSVIERAEELEFYAMRMRVARLEDVLTQKVLTVSEQQPDFSSVLELGRSLQEQVDWDDVRERTSESPFAKAYFTLLEELEILPALQKKN